MAPSHRTVSLDFPEALAGYDHRSVERGARYATQGRVEVIDFGPGWLTGEVQGGHHDPYVVDVEWMDGPRGLIVGDDCSCPLGGSCKHAVALIITATRPGGALSSSTRAPTPVGPPGVDWRQAMSKVVVPGSSAVLPAALQFSVQDLYSTRYGAPQVAQVLVRPMRMGAKGRWVKSGASWRDIESPYLHHDLRTTDPSHLAALRAMAHSSGSSLYSVGTGAVALDRFGPAVWSALRHAVGLGVELIGPDESVVVELAPDAAAFAVDLTATVDDGINVRAGFTRNDQPVALSPGHGATIGSPPSGLFLLGQGLIQLVELDQPLADGLVPLLRAGEIEVPRHDVDEFLDVYQPRLALSAPVGSSDGSVTDHASELVGLVARVDHHAVDAAHIEWSVRYRRGRRVTDHRLVGRTGAVRDRAAETALLAALDLPGGMLEPMTDQSGRPLDLSVRGADAVALLTQVVPWLVERGQVIVEVSGDAPTLRQAVGDPLVELDVRDPTDRDRSDWFDLAVEVSIDGERIAFAQLFSALALNEPVIVLRSGTWLRLDRPELDRLRELIGEAHGLTDPDSDGTIRINRFQSSWWEDLMALGVVRSQSARWERSVARMSELTAPEPVEPSVGLAAKLRHYQQEGLDWLSFLHRHELGGILADDMGLGKTIQTLALFLHVLDQRPEARFLVVAPTSVVSNWHREAATFAPGVDVCTITGTESRRGTRLADAIGDASVVVTSYALFRLEADDYRSLDWEILVLDEAQFVKNHRGKTYHCVRQLDATIKLAITGTPIENSLMDLWSLLSIVAPGLYPDPRRFSEVYRKPIESGRSPDLLATLRRRVAPLMRRRTKDEVLTELPPKIEQTVEVELSPRHMRIYQTQLQQQRKKVLGLVGDVDKHRFEILRSLTVLRQLSLDPALIDEAHGSIGSAKIDRLVEDLTQVLAEGHRALVFSTFTRYLSRVKARLDEAGIDYSYLDGRTRKREQAISAFTDGDVPVFVISLKAGGFGLNLTQADYCFVLDPWWNPAAETQAVDRAHRIGQENNVVVYRYVSTGTIEEKVMELKERKAALFSSVMDADDTLAGALDADDIRALIDLPG